MPSHNFRRFEKAEKILLSIVPSKLNSWYRSQLRSIVEALDGILFHLQEEERAKEKRKGRPRAKRNLNSKDQKKEYSRRYYQNNKERIRDYQKKRYQEKHGKNPNKNKDHKTNFEKFFAHAKNLHQLKAMRIELLKKGYHPDHGGDTETAKRINQAYDIIKKRLESNI